MAQDDVKSKVAVKIIFHGRIAVQRNAALINRTLDREVEVQGSLRHPNLLRLLGHGQDTIKRTLVLELCNGGDLLSINASLLSAVELLDCFTQMASGMPHVMPDMDSYPITRCFFN